MRPLTLQRIQAILDARLVRVPVDQRRCTVSMCTLRLMLLELARREGEPVRLEEMGDGMQIAAVGVRRAMRALMRMGLVERGSKVGGQRFRYSIQWSKLGERREAA